MKYSTTKHGIYIHVLLWPSSDKL